MQSGYIEEGAVALFLLDGVDDFIHFVDVYRKFKDLCPEAV